MQCGSRHFSIPFFQFWILAIDCSVLEKYLFLLTTRNMYSYPLFAIPVPMSCNIFVLHRTATMDAITPHSLVPAYLLKKSRIVFIICIVASGVCYFVVVSVSGSRSLLVMYALKGRFNVIFPSFFVQFRTYSQCSFPYNVY